MPETLETQPDNADKQQSAADGYIREIGQYCAFDWTNEPHYLSNNEVWVPEQFEDDGTRDTSTLSEDAKKSLLQIDATFAKTDKIGRASCRERV